MPPEQLLTPVTQAPQISLFKKLLLNLEKIIVLTSISVGFVYLLNYFLVRAKIQIPFLNIGITILILIYFWKKWRQTLLILFIGILTLFFEMIALAPFSINSDNFSTQIAASNILFAFLPFFMVLPFIGPVALVYAYFRGLLKDQSNIEIPTESVQIQTSRRRVFKYVAVVMGVILLLVIAGPAYYIFIYSGTRVESTTKTSDDPNIGKVISLGIPSAYSRDNLARSDIPRIQEVNRFLECIGDIDSVGAHHYKNGYYDVGYLPSTTNLKIIEVLNTENKGLAELGGSGLTYGVLEDNNGILYTRALVLLSNCNGRLEPHLEKLFLFIEQNGKTRVELTLWRDDNTAWNSPAVSTSVGQERLISDLNKIPSKYKVENIEKVDSYIPGMKAVAVDVNADTLVYLVASMLDFAVWEIKGLDKAYQDTLTEEDLSGFKKKPLDF